MLHNVVNALLNMILVSMPEELFLTVMTLIFLKRFDLLDIRMWRLNLKWIMIPVLCMSLNFNITKYIIQLPKVYCSLSSLIIFIVSFIYIIKINSYKISKKEYRKIFLGISLSFIIWGLLESITYPIFLYLINKPLEFVNNNILLNFTISIPSRVFAFSLIVFLIIKYNNTMKIRIFDVISKNKFLLRSIVSFAILSNILSVYIIKLIGSDRILENKVTPFEQIFISMCTLIIPTIILFWMLLLVNYLLVKEREIQQTYENLIIEDDVMADVDN